MIFKLWNKPLEIKYEKPNPHLYTFSGSMKLANGKEVPLTNNNFMLRACSLRTGYAIGVVCYTGYMKVFLN
jgi:hypothetical protein